MNASKLQKANELQAEIDTLGEWLERLPALPLHGPRSPDGKSLLSPATQQQVRALFQADVENRLAQLKQEFEAL